MKRRLLCKAQHQRKCWKEFELKRAAQRTVRSLENFSLFYRKAPGHVFGGHLLRKGLVWRVQMYYSKLHKFHPWSPANPSRTQFQNLGDESLTERLVRNRKAYRKLQSYLMTILFCPRRNSHTRTKPSMGFASFSTLIKVRFFSRKQGLKLWSVKENQILTPSSPWKKSRTRNKLPGVAFSSILIVPPISSTKELTMVNPNPVPPYSLVVL
jgi:hypothetical protein